MIRRRRGWNISESPSPGLMLLLLAYCREAGSSEKHGHQGKDRGGCRKDGQPPVPAPRQKAYRGGPDDPAHAERRVHEVEEPALALALHVNDLEIRDHLDGPLAQPDAEVQRKVQRG